MRAYIETIEVRRGGGLVVRSDHGGVGGGKDHGEADMNKNELRGFLEMRGITGFVPPAVMREALLVSNQTIRRWVNSKMLMQRDRGCFSSDDVLDFVWKNPRVIAKLKAKLYDGDNMARGEA